jgi:von Willebrand factor type A domain
MKNVGGMVICVVVLTLLGCTNSNVVIPSAKPPAAFEFTPSGKAADYCQTSVPQAASQTGYRQVTFVVSENGLPPPRLAEQDLRFEHNGKEIPIVYFREEPVSLGIVLDTSAGMAPKIDSMRVLLTELVNHLNPADQLFLMAFSSRAFVLHPFTGVHDAIVQDLSLLRGYGPANYREAVVSGLEQLRNGCYPEKVLLVIGDGNDTLSNATETEIRSDANKFRAKILTVGIGKVNAQPLEALTQGSGGGLILIGAGGAEAKNAGDTIANQLHDRYVAGFVTTANTSVRLDLLNHPFGILRIQNESANLQILTNN